jgi:hypothetical protein
LVRPVTAPEVTYATRSAAGAQDDAFVEFVVGIADDLAHNAASNAAAGDARRESAATLLEGWTADVVQSVWEQGRAQEVAGRRWFVPAGAGAGIGGPCWLVLVLVLVLNEDVGVVVVVVVWWWWWWWQLSAGRWCVRTDTTQW